METIQFENVSFRYPDTEKKALDNVSFSAESGEFILLCGKSGCGKTTLLRQLKKSMIPYGEFDGSVKYMGQEVSEMSDRESAVRIGFVQQNPDNQIVTDKVWHELAFGLESIGLDNQSIRRRVAEMASYFNIQSWFRKNTSDLSGGQKQMLNLASIMVMQPELLILDEPTSQLDPVAANDFLTMLKRINGDFGTTVLISEHRLQDVFVAADRVLVMEKAHLIADGSPEEVGRRLATEQPQRNDMFYGLPTVMRMYYDVKPEGKCPLTIKESRKWAGNILGPKRDLSSEIGLSKADSQASGFARAASTGENQAPAGDNPVPTGDIQGTDRGARGNSGSKPVKTSRSCKGIIHVRDLWFRYDRKGDDVIRGLDLDVREGELFAVMGGNGAGKSTLLKLIEGVMRYQRGSIEVGGIKLDKGAPKELYDHLLAGLPQSPQALFTEITAEEELLEALHYTKLSDDDMIKRVDDMLKLMEIDHLRKNHPYDLSGGEQQRLALGKILLLEPKILVLDEPTKSLDPFFRLTLSGIFKKLLKRGVTILMVSHDIEFCAENADRCAMFFDGGITSVGTPKEFFAGNDFYTTVSNKVVRDWFPDAVTYEEAASCIRNTI